MRVEVVEANVCGLVARQLCFCLLYNEALVRRISVLCGGGSSLHGSPCAYACEPRAAMVLFGRELSWATTLLGDDHTVALFGD